MKKDTIFKKTISFILLISFLVNSNVYPCSIETKLRPPLQTSSENINRFKEALNLEKRGKSMSALVSNQTVFTDKQKKTIFKEIEKYGGVLIQDTKEALGGLEQSGVLTPQNRETIFTILKEIPQYAKGITIFAYDSLKALLESGLITETNQKELFSVLNEIPQYAESSTWRAYNSLRALLESGLITETNQKELFSVLKEIPQHAGSSTDNVYYNLTALLKSGLITEANYEKVLKDFTAILKEIPQYAGKDASSAYNSLTALLKSGLITETIQEEVFAILKEIPQYARSNTSSAYDSLTVLVKPGLIAKPIRQEVSTLIKEIPRYAGENTGSAYNSLIALLESGLITKTNQEEIFTILKEIPQHANRDTHKAYDSLLDVLKLMKQKNLLLDQDSLMVILNMIKQGDKDSGVKGTLDAIRDFILARVKDPVIETGPGSSGSLSALLNSTSDGKIAESSYAELRSRFAASNTQTQGNVGVYNFAMELEQFMLRRTLITKLTGRTSFNVDDVEKDPLVIKLKEMRIFLTAYLVDKISKNKTQENINKYLDMLVSQIQQFEIESASTQPEALSEEKKPLFYNWLHRQYPSVMARVTYGGFEKSPLVYSILNALKGDDFYISDSDIIEMINLSLDIDEMIRKYAATNHPNDDLWITSFREQIRLHAEFIRWYLSSVKEGGVEIKHTLEYFILSCLSIYGGMFGEESDKFKGILRESISKNFAIFVKLSLGEKSLKGAEIDLLIEKLLYESFTTLDKEKEENLLWGVQPYQRAYYSMLRCVEMSEPGLFILSRNSHRAFEEAVEKVSQDTKGEVVRIPLSYFSERSDLFGMSVPDDQGNPGFLLGVIPRMAERATANPNTPIYLVLDNIEAVQGSLRVELNPVLWEKSFVIPEINKRFKVPKNLHIIFSMDESSEVHDEAFLNRVLRQRIGGLSEEDFKNLLVNKHGISEEWAGELSNLFFKLGQETWKQHGLFFSAQDFVNIAIYAKNRGEKIEFLKEEIYRYINLRFRYQKDRKKFGIVFNSLFGAIPEEYKRSHIEIRNGKLTADGVSIGVSEEFAASVGSNPGKKFSEIVLEDYDYVIRGIDLMLISQLVRQAAFREEAASRVIVLEGVSGEGKTQLCQVVSRILGYKNLGFTVHKRSALEEFRGGVFPGKEGLEIHNDTPFLKAEREGGYLINFSELNTSYKGSLLYWLYPEFSLAGKRLLPEIPAPPGTGEPFYVNPISSGNIYVADINPDDYRARERFPQQNKNFSAAFWMGYDYSEEDEKYQKGIKQEIIGLTKELFRIHFNNLPKDEIDKYSAILGELYYFLQKDMANGQIRSLYQVLTLRDVIRTIKMFRYYQKTKGQASETAFKNAVKSCLWLMWQEKEPQEKIKARLLEMDLWIKEDLDIKGFIRDALVSNLGHLIIHSNAAGDGYEIIKEALPAENITHYMSVSDFIELENLVGETSVDLEGKLGVFQGALLKIIEQAESDPGKEHLFILDNFHQLNPDTAIGLNKALQEGRIELSPSVASVYKGRLVDARFAVIPENLRIIALTYITKEPSHDDKLPMSGAELSRLVSVALPDEMSGFWIEGYLRDKLRIEDVKGEIAKEVISKAKLIYEAYVKEYENGNHSQIRLSKRDLDEYLAQILRTRDNLDAKVIGEIAYYTIGMCLSDKAREPFMPRSPPSLEYIQKNGGIYLKVGLAEYKTGYSDIASSHRESYLCPVDEVLEIYESILSAYMEDRKLILLEGPPGGGKTAIAEDIAKRLNLRFKKISMYREIDLWEFLGKIERVGHSKFKITCGKEEGKFLSEFLDFLENGGVWCFDEANISKASIEAMSFITQIVRGEPIDLGIYHNGVKIGEHLISVHPDFKAFITINPWETTKERKDIPLEILWLAKKIYVTDNWKEESYRKLIDYYLKDKNAMTREDIGRLIKLHIFMKYIMDEQFKDSYKGDIPEEVKGFSFSEFNELYTYQYGVSPRELIRITELVNRHISLFEAILLNYLFQFSAPSDLKRAIDIVEKVFPGFKEFYTSWQKERSVYFRGKEVKLENPERENFFTPVSSQITSLKALALSLSGGKQHTLILSEQGSYPLELVRFFSQAMGCELFVFDSSPFVNSVELLGSQMVKFGDLNQKGTAESTDELGTVLGFIGEHLIKEDEYDEKTAQDKPIKILYLSSIDTMSSEELESLNDFLNTGRIRIGDKYYVLPGNVRIVAETSVLRKKRFSSPFYNRFQKIGLGAVIERDEVFTYLDKYYPGLSTEEKSLIYGAAKTAWYLDMGRYGVGCNLDRNKFTYRYGFSIKDVYKLAELVVQERMSQADAAKVDSVKTVLTCILRLYGNGMDDTSSKDKPSDRKLYFGALFEEVFKYEGIDENTIKELESKIREVEREWVDIVVSPKELNDGITLTNGFRIKEEGEYIAIGTPINKYRIKKDSLSQETELSGGLKVRLEKTGLLVSISMIKSIGQIDSATDTNYGLPPEEVPRRDYINYTGAINEAASIIFWASRRVEDSTGRERPPLPIILMGKTGGAKSTIVRNLSRITGAPLHTLHCYDNMEPDALFAGMGIAQKGKERKILFSLKEFFSDLGKINGEYYYPPGKNRHSTRKILFLDEANVSPQILYCLKPLFRGDRNFTFYLFGEKFTVELDPEVILFIAGNPPETHSDRKSFPWEIIEDGLKIWVPALHTYLESERVKKEDLVSILFGMHKRKMKELETDAQEDETYAAESEKLTNNALNVIKLEPLKIPDTGYARYDRRKPFAEPGKSKKEDMVTPIRKDISFEYSIQKITEGLKRVGSIQDGVSRYQYFLDNILRDYLLALSDGAGNIKWYKDGDKESLTYMVLETASAIDNNLFECLRDIVNLYLQPSINYSRVRERLMELRKKVLTNEAVNRFIFSFPILKDNRLFILVETEKIKERVLIEKGHLEELGIETTGFKDKIPLVAYVVERHPFMEEKRARGVFKGENYALIYEESTLASSGQTEKGELISWVGYHEIGHLVDHIRSLSEQISSHPNIELFSMLFPVIFAKDNKRYVEKELLYLLNSNKDASSYYCQAAKGIFNGFLRVLKEENPGDSQLQEIKEITDSFEDEYIHAIYKKIAVLDKTLISKIGIRLYKDAWEKKFIGDYYLSTAKKGRYKSESDKARGDAISEFTEGIANPPDVEVKQNEQQEIEQKVEIKSDAKEKEDMPGVEFEGNGEGGGEEGEVSLEGVVVEKGWLETYYQKLGSFAKKFIDIFASEPKQEEVHAASGRRLDIRKWITLSQKVFKRTIIEESTPSLYMSVTVDVSGSIAGSPALVKAFTNMTKFFESLLYVAGRNTSSVRFSLSAIGEEFHRVFGFDDCKKEDILRGSVQALWQQNDFGGINTASLVTGLRRLYGQSVIPTGNRLHIVLTDGGETSGKSFEELKTMVNSFEEEYGVNVIFIGVGTKEVTSYNRYLLLGEDPNDSQLMNILIRIAREKVQRGNLPLGDLSKALGLETPVLKTKDASMPLASNQTVFTPRQKAHGMNGAGSGFAQNDSKDGERSRTIKPWSFTDEQKKAIFKEIEKYCGGYIKHAEESLGELEQSGVITPQNREAIFTILKEIPQYAGNSTSRAYNSLTALLKSGLITETNYEKVLKDFTTIL
ncbi:MAG: AAA family ATPase, partial [Candidatus Omnitrophota bacterium]|nr:AAA family ATPase [Candidatus Omnitrophota bacterium]